MHTTGTQPVESATKITYYCETQGCWPTTNATDAAAVAPTEFHVGIVNAPSTRVRTTVRTTDVLARRQAVDRRTERRTTDPHLEPLVAASRTGAADAGSESAPVAALAGCTTCKRLCTLLNTVSKSSSSLFHSSCWWRTKRSTAAVATNGNTTMVATTTTRCVRSNGRARSGPRGRRPFIPLSTHTSRPTMNCESWRAESLTLLLSLVRASAGRRTSAPCNASHVTHPAMAKHNSFA
jgi:hypothetical protein